MCDWWCQRGEGCFTDELHVIMCNVEVGSMIMFCELLGYKGNGTGV